ncbi:MULTISPECIES: RusA family crossover junction endodeoxyribonuclease [unclassified Lactobacillus]|uniref:RusA family crossover junction endodeoxyribonuclease n=1 Tax=unclassified Lactobacillus TaxID=2620435 RepID=UPI000EFC2B0A|nr:MULTISPECIES: RusA family crossover junction endodeoxyribonuclease [unclassified Lactobacillus]RMC24443.1 RusA family crossover junction endodeoxyribonuclease [Lactobacillus sp. ESL0247]RMC28582.1 RusA family crossover junction endodeoxyribonuclease [Lactobacillus sp. ESL0246]RMC31774.1 RusA family crossover junction endodeoxyribonuclease [Lactobacillus sp. ESL0245]
MERRLKFIVPGEPKSKARPRFSRRGGHVITYTPDDTHDYENQVRYSAQVARRAHNINKPISKDMAISIKVFFGIPTSYSKKRKARCLSGEERPTKKPDSDNIAKIVLDGLNPKMKVNHALHKAVCLREGLYRDDKQVVDLRVEKWYGEKPQIEVTAVWHEE